MKNLQKGIAPIIIALIVAVVLGGGYMFIKQSGKNSSKVEDKIVSSVANWKTYKNEEYGFEFKYPKEWTISDTSKGAINTAFEYSVYPPCDSSECNDRGPLIQVVLLNLNISFNEYIGNKNFSNKSAYTLGGKAGFAVSSLSGSTYIFEKDGKAFRIIVGNPGIKEKSIGEEANKIFSTFKFTTPATVQLPKAISSIVENKLSIWVTLWKNINPNFNLASFSKENESTISSAYKINPCDAKCSSIFDDMKNLYAFSPNGEKFIDVHGGQIIEVKNGKHVFVPGEPDSSVLVIDKKLQTIQTVLFCGTPCGFNNAAWIDNNSFVVVGGESISDAEGINYKGQVATLYVINLATQKVELYKWPTIPAQDTFTTSGTVAVFFNPSQEWIENMKKIDEEGFYIGSDDAVYYSVTAKDFLKTKNIKTISTFSRYIDFKKDNGQHIIIDRNSKNEKGLNNEGWGLFLFDGKQDPLNADMTVIESEYKKYLK